MSTAPALLTFGSNVLWSRAPPHTPPGINDPWTHQIRTLRVQIRMVGTSVANNGLLGRAWTPAHPPTKHGCLGRRTQAKDWVQFLLHNDKMPA